MPSREELLTRAALGELSSEERRQHEERLARDDRYRTEFRELVLVREAIGALPAPTLAPGLDRRVLARLRAAQGRSQTVDAMRRQFWRLAGPALAAAAVLVALALRPSKPAATNTDMLAVWYPLSTDPTVDH